ncbi:S-adenosyl-L-methionine-dependent methyltransferase-like [Pleurostoma richardsiae]|uniref:S-adenosyl-L-methionine-dependent methyltransferase-like n=1 Tax=Pleurostoma richardsiae TaxID=41990 RepID=A0AA38S4S2_9PEZI|nr:S-adenosyl-L-methionine-dependent methyltransferase-like [Pleurostoma richardsiae]
MGQALLARHEAYMASAERDRADMQTRIQQLEMDKRSLEAENARTIDENRALLDQLEQLNNTVADSETRINSLEASLRSSQMTIRNLEGAASRAEEMEKHIAVLEAEQATLQSSLITTESEARSAMHRWRKAERGISDLQEQLERIEKEGREERERHAEVLNRMERQRALDKDLNTAAGRLKGAAAAKSLTAGKHVSGVVSHFVRDLLQDNANLQLGIAELRELLLNSNDEIQVLREQLMYHQPLGDGQLSAASTLRAELQPKEDYQPSPNIPAPTSMSQELHIHHHYHVVNKAEMKKPKKKRQVLGPNVFTPPNTSSPSTPPSAQWRLQGSPAPAMLSHNARDSVSTVPSNRWSLFSEQPSDFAPSSAPSSPQSNRRNSVFDPGNVDSSSIPTSPTTSVDPMSPSLAASHRRNKESEVSIRNFVPPAPLHMSRSYDDESNLQTPQPFMERQSQEDLEHQDGCEFPGPDDIPDLTSTGPTTDDSVGESVDSPATIHDHDGSFLDTAISPSIDDGSFDEPITPRPRLYRAMSHESIMSLSGGLDIHTLKMRPSQLTLRPLGASAADTGLSAVIASPMIARGSDAGKRGSRVLRESLGLPTPRMANDRVVSGPVTPSSTAARQNQRQTSSGGLGKWVGWRPWGGSTASSPSAARTTATGSPEPLRSGKNVGNGGYDPKTIREKNLSRTPGINQAGAIPGFHQYWAAHQKKGAPSRVHADVVDHEALREVLEE